MGFDKDRIRELANLSLHARARGFVIDQDYDWDKWTFKFTLMAMDGEKITGEKSECPKEALASTLDAYKLSLNDTRAGRGNDGSKEASKG